jgi:hypothetical protein
MTRATAGSQKIIWENCATGSNSLEALSVNDIRAITAFGPLTSTGSATSSVVDTSNSTATVHCELSNATASGQARCFGLWVRIEGDTSNVLAVIARLGAGVTATFINSSIYGLVNTFADVAINVGQGTATTIFIDPSGYAQSSALAVTNTIVERLQSTTIRKYKSWVDAQINASSKEKFIIQDDAFMTMIYPNTQFSSYIQSKTTGGTGVEQFWKICDIRDNLILTSHKTSTKEVWIAIYDLSKAVEEFHLNIRYLTLPYPIVWGWCGTGIVNTYNERFCVINGCLFAHVGKTGDFDLSGSFTNPDFGMTGSLSQRMHAHLCVNDWSKPAFPTLQRGWWYGISNLPTTNLAMFDDDICAAQNRFNTPYKTEMMRLVMNQSLIGYHAFTAYLIYGVATNAIPDSSTPCVVNQMFNVSNSYYITQMNSSDLLDGSKLYAMILKPGTGANFGFKLCLFMKSVVTDGGDPLFWRIDNSEDIDSMIMEHYQYITGASAIDVPSTSHYFPAASTRDWFTIESTGSSAVIRNNTDKWIFDSESSAVLLIKSKSNDIDSYGGNFEQWGSSDSIAIISNTGQSMVGSIIDSESGAVGRPDQSPFNDGNSTYPMHMSAIGGAVTGRWLSGGHPVTKGMTIMIKYTGGERLVRKVSGII